MKAGFPVYPGSPFYARFIKHRDAFGTFLHAASLSFHSEADIQGRKSGEEHIDAVLSVIRAIDTFLLDYAVTRNSYAAQKKSYEVSRDLATTHSKQKYFPRNVWIKRAQVMLSLVSLIKMSEADPGTSVGLSHLSCPHAQLVSPTNQLRRTLVERPFGLLHVFLY